MTALRLLSSLLMITASSLALAASPIVFQGKVQGETGYLARAGYTDCQVMVLEDSVKGLQIDFQLLNTQTGERLELPDLNLSKAGRVGLLEKMMYDFGARTAPQPVTDSAVVPQAYQQYNNLVNIKNGGNAIDYHFQELRTNGEFYSATSELTCLARAVAN
jgi:hypothetical protein